MPGAISREECRDIAARDDVDHIVGSPSSFAIGYRFLGDERFTVLAMYLNGSNLLGFSEVGTHYTTRWGYLEDLVGWLKAFVENMAEDPYPVQVEGEYAAQKDDVAREFDTDDMGEFDAYYDRIDVWTRNHTWRHESGGAVLANVFFEFKNGLVELSWDNRDDGSDIVFDCEFGGGCIDAESFKTVVLKFVDAYERHWGIKMDDDSTWLRKS